MLFVFGCTTLKQPDFHSSNASALFIDCYKKFQVAENILRQHDQISAYATTLDGYPFFRTNRFFSEVIKNHHELKAEIYWLQHLNEFALESIRTERKNLPIRTQPLITMSELASCQPEILNYYRANPEEISDIKQSAMVSDEYQEINKVLGLYPITALPIRAGVKGWHKEAYKAFAQAPVAENQWLDYSVINTNLVALNAPHILKSSAKNPLNVPTPGASDLERLVLQHAPIWRVDTKTSDDRVGTPYVNSDSLKVNVTTKEASLYWYKSYTLFEGKTLLQLNYIIWFPARPKTNPLDTLGGPLDGVHWRVTLSQTGEPLMYDTMHNCGCYHMFFPSEKLKLNFEAHLYQEPILIPKNAPSLKNNEKIVLYLAPQTHYLIGVEPGVAEKNSIPLTLKEYKQTEALPVSHSMYNHKSMYDKNGLVNESARLERFLFWPMGIPSAGSMRQRGTHATAFIGERHFDDANLFDELFINNH